MILAAGRGERMRPLTDDTPKPLLTVAGRALIDYHLDNLARAGFLDIVINVSWRAEDIVAHVGNGSRFGVRVQWSHEQSALETGGGIAHAREWLGDGWFALVSADVFAEYDFRRLCDLGKSLDADTEARLVVVPHHSDLRGEYRFEGDRLLMVEGAGPGAETFSWASLAVFRARLFDGLPRDQPFALLPLFRQWMSERRVGAEVYAGLWENLGTERQLQDLRAALAG
ncbi:MAG: nucleotidyltransferase family protein [Betaproteobacteria bacterium]|nr:nucleotidyltransferase family protein [Betaproteobacteria bacterium]